MHKHSVPEQTFRDFVENAVSSYLKRGDTSSPRSISSTAELVDTIVQVAECPVCSAGMRLQAQSTVVLFKKLEEGSKRPDKKHPDDAGWDLYANRTVDLMPGIKTEVPTGIALEMPNFLYCAIAGKSTFGALNVHTFPGIIDSGFRGHLTVFMTNFSNERITIRRYQKCAQLIFHYNIPLRFDSAAELNSSARGEGKQGSTGRF